MQSSADVLKADQPTTEPVKVLLPFRSRRASGSLPGERHVALRRVRPPAVRRVRRDHARAEGPRLHREARRPEVRHSDRARIDRTDEDLSRSSQAAVRGHRRTGQPEPPATSSRSVTSRTNTGTFRCPIRRLRRQAELACKQLEKRFAARASPRSNAIGWRKETVRSSWRRHRWLATRWSVAERVSNPWSCLTSTIISLPLPVGSPARKAKSDSRCSRAQTNCW